jgi:hypothetical protein
MSRARLNCRAQLGVNFFTRVDPDTDERRRRLQRLTGLSAPRLVRLALIEYERLLEKRTASPADTAAS